MFNFTSVGGIRKYILTKDNRWIHNARYIDKGLLPERLRDSSGRIVISSSLGKEYIEGRYFHSTSNTVVDNKKTREETKYDNWVARTKSNRPHLDVDLTFEEWVEIRKTKKCYYTGKPFIHEKDHPRSRTLERINPALGYVVGNVVCVSLIANKAKSDFDAFWLNNQIPLELKVNLCRLVAEAYVDQTFGEDDVRS